MAKKKKNCFIVVNLLNSNDVTIYRFKRDVAGHIGCHESSLRDLYERKVINDHLIITATIC